MKNKSKKKKLSFSKKIFSWYQISSYKCSLYIFIVYTKYQDVPEINIGGVEFLVQALSKLYVELQRAVTLKVYINVHAKFDVFPSYLGKTKTLQSGRNTDGRSRTVIIVHTCGSCNVYRCARSNSEGQKHSIAHR